MKLKINKKIASLYMLTATLCLTNTVFSVPQEVFAFPTSTNVSIAGTADAAIIMDFESGEVLYEKNADQMLIPASLTKIMTTYIIYEEIEAGNLTLDSMIKVSSNAAAISVNQSYSQAVPLTAGSTLSVSKLIELILIPSASASCIVMAEHISGSEKAFVERMNETAKRLGMDVAYENCHGSKIHYVTARSQAILLRDFMDRFPEVLKYTSMSSMWFNGKSYVNTNRFMGMSPYPNVDGFKSGNITASEYCLASTINRDGYRLISITLKSDSREAMYKENINLFEHSYTLLKTNSTAYDGIGTHANRKDIEKFYATGFSPYTAGSTYLADSDTWSEEFNGILKNIVEYYGLDVDVPEVVGENLTKEKALSIIDNVFPFMPCEEINFSDRGNISPELLSSVDRTIKAGILSGLEGADLYPQETFTKSMMATTICNLVDYIESNKHWLPSIYTTSTVDLSEPVTVNVPFDFNTYSTLYGANLVGNYTAREVKLLSVADGGWWQVDVDGTTQWLYTQDKLTYLTKYQPVYSDTTNKEMIGIMSPQVMNVMGEENGYIKLSTNNGFCYVESKYTSSGLSSEISFNIEDSFTLQQNPVFNDVNVITYNAQQQVELMSVGENGFWYVKTNDGAEGWLYAKNQFVYVGDNTSLYDSIGAETPVASLGKQILPVEEVSGDWYKVPTWLGSKWLRP